MLCRRLVSYLPVRTACSSDDDAHVCRIPGSVCEKWSIHSWKPPSASFLTSAKKPFSGDVVLRCTQVPCSLETNDSQPNGTFCVVGPPHWTALRWEINFQELGKSVKYVPSIWSHWLPQDIDWAQNPTAKCNPKDRCGRGSVFPSWESKKFPFTCN